MALKVYARICLAFIIVSGFILVATPPQPALGHHELIDVNDVNDVNDPNDEDDPPCDNPCGCASGGHPVFMRNGEFALYATDIFIRDRVLPVQIVRTYGSRREYNSRFGYGWDINYNLKVKRLDDPNTIVLLNGKGCRFEYERDTSDPNIYKRSTDLSSYFYYDNDTFTLIETSGTEYGFDINGNLSSITDENGNAIKFRYDPNDLLPLYGPSEFFLGEEFGGPPGGRGLIAMSYKLTKITDDLKREITLSYNDDGLLETVTDFAGRTWDYTYDPCTNDLWYVTGPTGLTVSYVYNANNHNLVYVYDANGQQVVRNYYNSEDKVWKQTVGDGSYEFNHDPTNNTTTITDREGFDTKMVYGDSGQLLTRTVYTADANDDPCSFTTTYVYNENLKKIREIFSAGNCIDYTYDDLGNITAIYRKIGPNEPNYASDDPNYTNDPNVIATIYTYDPNFVYKVKTITDAKGNVTTYDYNEVTGNLEKITYPTVTTPEGNVTPIEYYTYDANGQVETFTAADGIVTKYVYYTDANDANNFGHLWKMIVDANESDPGRLEITTVYKYDIVGNVIEVNDPNGNITRSVYNELNQLTKITAPSPFSYVTNFSYDKNGNQSGIEREISNEPNQITSFTYKVRSKLKKMTGPLGYVTMYGYNKNEEPNLVIDAEDHNTVSIYNERGLLAEVTDANGKVTRYSYDENGNLSDINDANGNLTHYDYDRFDRLICITYPDSNTEVFSYDKNSNITSKTNRGGQTIYYEYDAMNRMIVKNRPGDPNTTYLYDIAGRVHDVNDLRDVADGGGLTQYSYDRVGRVKKVINTDGKTVRYNYDERGLRTKLNYPGPGYITYEYDASGRLTKVESLGLGVLATYEYDELSRRILLTLGNDANAVYEYDLSNRLKKLTNNLDASNSIVFDYNDYDKVGNRLSMKIDDANAHIYIYDQLYQLTDVNYSDGNSTAYSYDALGNRTSVVNGGSTSYVSNNLNQYTSVGVTSYTYDAKGNLTDDNTYKYYYDCENRLIDVNQDGNSIATYAYDYLGRRVKKIIYGSPDVTIKYCYDGDQVIAEYDGNGTLLRRFFYGPGIDEPICMIDIASGNKVYYYHFDGLGSVVALSNVNREIVEYYEYDVYGGTTIRDSNGLEISESSVGNPFMFTGRRYDNESGLYYYRYRYYAPHIGRFLQTDPIGYEGGLNLYTYVKNNPANQVDPYGLKGYFGGGVGTVEGILLPKDAENSRKEECNVIDGYYIHCVATCRLTRLTGGGLAYGAALSAGGDWPSKNESENNKSDRRADRQGVKNAFKFWKTCKKSCKQSQKKAIKKYCPPPPCE